MTEAGLLHSTYVYNGIDRVDNAVGYLPANCVPCCTVCNRAKGTLGLGDFVEWARRIASKFNLEVSRAA